MKFFDNKLKNALDALIGKKFMKNSIKEHRETLLKAYDLMKQNSNTNPNNLIMTSPKKYKEIHQKVFLDCYRNEKYALSYKKELSKIFKIAAIIPMTFFVIGISILTFKLITLEVDTITLKSIQFLISMLVASASALGLSFVLENYVYSKAIKNIDNHKYIKETKQDLIAARKGMILQDNSILFMDFSDRYSSNKGNLIQYSDIKNIFIKAENETIECFDYTDENDLIKKKTIYPDKEGIDPCNQELIIDFAYNRISFLAPCGPNGEDAYQIAELIWQNKKAAEQIFLGFLGVHEEGACLALKDLPQGKNAQGYYIRSNS